MPARRRQGIGGDRSHAGPGAMLGAGFGAMLGAAIRLRAARGLQSGVARWLQPLALVVAFAVIAWLTASGGNPADLRASWLAASFFGAGQPDLIYPGDPGTFQMRPPAEWSAAARATGYEGELFPFIYPPLWAALLSWLTPLVDFARFQAGAGILNPVLLGATILLARKACGAALSPLRWMAVAALVLLPTTIGAHALLQQQPQILVAFLIVLAVERQLSGHPAIAGAALALAAALKVYPAIYALFWLAQGERRAAGAFVLFGGALGLLSILLAGWPLHAAFLHELGTISATGLVNGVAYNLDASIAQLFHRDALVPVVSLFAGPVPDDAGGVFVLAKGPFWAAASRLVLLSVIIACILAFRRARPDHTRPQRRRTGQTRPDQTQPGHPGANQSADAALWPMAMVAVAFVSPMAFAYHYLAPATFAPLLIDRLGLRAGLAALAAGFLPTVMVLPIPLPPPPFALYVYQSMGAAAMICLAASFVLAARKRR